MNSEQQKAWYVVQTKPNREDWVCQHLSFATIETFNPKIRSFGQGSLFREKHLFPSYIFARAMLKNPNLHRLVRFTRGVTRILGVQSTPIPVSDDVVSTIRSYLNQDGCVEQKVFLKAGEAVRVKKGPLYDLVGILEKPVSPTGRVQVLLQLMQRQIRTFLHCSELERYA